MRQDSFDWAHLRTLPDAGHLQTLTIPQLGQTTRRNRRVRSFFGRSKRQSPEEVSGDCDPTQFVNEVAAYLSRACEVRAQVEAPKATQAELDESSTEAERPVTGNVATEERLATGAAHFGVGAPDNSVWTSGGQDPVGARPDETLAVELDRVRAEADQTLTVQLDVAEERHRADIVRLEAEAGERVDAAERAETALGTPNRWPSWATAEARHGGEIARVETEAAELSDAATRDAQATAEAEAGDAIAAERERVRHDAERTLVDELASAQERHHADIAALNAEATARSEVATRAAQAAAEALAEETLATERARLPADADLALATALAAAEERHRAEIVRLEAEAAQAHESAAYEPALDRVRADAERTLAAELAAAEERNRAEILRVRADTKESLADQLEQVQAEADQARDEVARLVAARQTSASSELRPNVESASWRSAAGSTSIPRHASAGPVGRRTYQLAPDQGNDTRARPATDYYTLWTARSDGDTAPPAPTPTEPQPPRGRARRRWALAAAALLVILLTNDQARDSPLGRALCAGAADLSQMVGPPGTMPPLDEVTSPRTETVIDDSPRARPF